MTNLRSSGIKLTLCICLFLKATHVTSGPTLITCTKKRIFLFFLMGGCYKVLNDYDIPSLVYRKKGDIRV